MTLSEYLKTLKTGDVIDPNILQVMMDVPYILPDDSSPYTSYSSAINYNYMFSYVRWLYGTLCFGEMMDNTELLSTRFCGCYLSLFRDNGIQYGCHIHRTTGSSCDQKDHWNEYASYLSDVMIFQPDVKLKLSHPDTDYDLWGIINPNSRKCFSVMVQSTTEFIRSNYASSYQADVRFIELRECWPLPHKKIPSA